MTVLDFSRIILALAGSEASGLSTIRAKRLVPSETSGHDKAGEISSPSQVNFLEIDPLSKFDDINFIACLTSFCTFRRIIIKK